MEQSIERFKGGLAVASASLVLPLGALAMPGDLAAAQMERADSAPGTVEPNAPAYKDPADQLREQLAKERADWHAERKRLLLRANAKRPTVHTALELAHATFGVPINGLVALASCESGQTPGAQNKTPLSGSNGTGYTQILYNPRGIQSSTWHTTPYAELSPFDLTTNVLAAGFIWWRNDGKPQPGFGEWRDICARRANAVSRQSARVTFRR